MLQVALAAPQNLLRLGEESAQQIKMRAERIAPTKAEHCYILTETKTQNIFRHIADLEPDTVIIDSIQTLQTDYIESTAGSISQIRSALPNSSNLPWNQHPVVLIGHITRTGTLPDPRSWSIW